MPDLVVCQRCHEPVPTSQLLEHLRLLHPDVDAEPGDTVAEDLTIQVIPKCECPDLDITTVEDIRNGIHRFIKGWAPDCPVHGYEGISPTYRKVMGFTDGGS